MEVPSMTWYLAPGRILREFVKGAASLGSTDPIPIPGALISGFCRPNREGPRLEKSPMSPTAGGLV